MVEWAVEAAKLVAAEVEIQQAISAYRSAVEKAQQAGDTLAANWEGDAREAFVEEQAKAYQWHMNIYDVVLAFVKTLLDTALKYEEAEQQINALISNG